MPRTVSSKVHVPLPAREVWRMRCSFELERHIATLSKRALTLLEEETACAGEADERLRRVVRCDLTGDPLGGKVVMGVGTKDLGSEIESTHFVHLHDEAHGAEFSVRMAMRRINLTLQGHQWCLPEGEASCFLCTRVYVHARLVGIGGLVEIQLERHLRAAHAAFPAQALSFVATLPEAPGTPPASPVEVEDVDVAVALVAQEPSLGRWWLLGDAMARALPRRGSRRLLPSGGTTTTTTTTTAVRVGQRHARLLLACGCASAVAGVESDEVVE